MVAGGDTAGANDGPVGEATFNNPVNVIADDDGTIYVADFDNSRVRQIRNGRVTTLVQQANFNRPFGLAIASDGTLYVQTDGNDNGERDNETGTVWRVNKATGEATVVVRNVGRPRGMVGLPDGRIVLSNLTRNSLSFLDPATGAITPLAGKDGEAGFADGAGDAVRFDRPYGLARQADGTLLVADQNNNRIRRVNLNGTVTTFAGTGVAGHANGRLSQAQFSGPQDVEVNQSGTVFVADNRNFRIRIIGGGQVDDFAGDGTPGFADGQGVAARLFGMEGMSVSRGSRLLYVADGTGGEDEPFHRVRKFGF